MIIQILKTKFKRTVIYDESKDDYDVDKKVNIVKSNAE